MEAIEKAVALMESIDGRMGVSCPVCRGGWWFEGEVCVASVHASECSRSSCEPSRPEAADSQPAGRQVLEALCKKGLLRRDRHHVYRRVDSTPVIAPDLSPEEEFGF